MTPTHVPIKMYQTTERLIVAAPMAGLEPTDIVVRVTEDGRLALRGNLRGPRQEAMELLMDEWSVGPYERILTLPCPVDAQLADVTLGNGVLVVALPKAERLRPAELVLEPTGHTRGQYVGSPGKGITPTTTEDHRQAKAAAAAPSGAR